MYICINYLYLDAFDGLDQSVDLVLEGRQPGCVDAALRQDGLQLIRQTRRNPR